MAKEKRLSLSETAGILKLTRQRVHQLYEAGRIPAEQIGNQIVFLESAVHKFKKEKRPPGRPPNVE